jgi:hypothetical protein
VLLLLSTLAVPAFAADPKTVELAASYQPTWGGEIASTLNDLLPVLGRVAGYEINLLVGFNQRKEAVEITLFGGRTTIDSAKSSTDDFRSKVLAGALTVLAGTYGITLRPDQYRITYVNQESKKALLIFEDGKYTVL